jgi:hypothetical protein
MYVIPVTPESAPFISAFLNAGDDVSVEKNITFFVFGGDKPDEIITAKECQERFGNAPQRASAQVFEVE